MNRRLSRRGALAFNPFTSPGVLFNSPEGEGGGAAAAGGGAPAGASPAWAPPASQDELDRIISDRLSRERAKFADYDDLKAKASEHDKAVEAARSEQERAVDAARKEGESTATQRANAILAKAEARALAAEANFRTPADAVAFLDLASIKVTENGDVDAEALKVALKKLAEEKPYLLADEKPARPKPDGSQGPRTGSTSAADAGRAEAQRRFKKNL